VRSTSAKGDLFLGLSLLLVVGRELEPVVVADVEVPVLGNG